MVSSRGANEVQSERVLPEQAYLQLARRIKKLAGSVCGLWPIGSGASFPNLPIDVAQALAALGNFTGIVVRQQHWQDRSTDSEPLIKSLGEGVECITPVRSGSGVSAALEHVLAAVHGRYSQTLLDLSGLDIGCMTEIAILPELKILLLLAPGTVSEFSLARLYRRLPKERLLGAVLVDPQTEDYGK